MNTECTETALSRAPAQHDSPVSPTPALRAPLRQLRCGAGQQTKTGPVSHAGQFHAPAVFSAATIVLSDHFHTADSTGVVSSHKMCRLR